MRGTGQENGNRRQVALGFLAAVVSIWVVIGSILLAFGEDETGRSSNLAATESASQTPAVFLTSVPTQTPGGATATETEASPTATATSAQAAAACPPPAGWVAISVQAGDTLESLAGAYGLDLGQLKEANCLVRDRLDTGILLYVPAKPTETASATLVPSKTAAACGPPRNWVAYVVRRGDTLYSLATRTGTTVRELQFANCLSSPDRIRAGQTIYLPKLPTTSTPTLTATATMAATPNSPPVGSSDSYTTDEDTNLNIAAPGVLGNDSDPNGDALTAVLAAAPSHGSLTLNPNGSFSYSPAANFNGSDSFTYRANDGVVNSNIVSVTITVNPVNDTPVAVGDSYSMNEDTVLNITAPGVLGNDSDIEGDLLTAILVSGTGNGSLSLQANGGFTYTPDADFSGSDSFTYKANDGSADSNTATVTITVNPVNDAPTAVDDIAATDEDTPVNIDVLANDTDVDGPSLTISAVTQGAHGTVVNNGTNVIYTPDLDWNGIDTFTYTVSDGSETDTATVTVTVIPP